MCGIFAVIGNQQSENFEKQRVKFLNCSKLLRHRGPDWNGIYINDDKKFVIAHERLSIIDVDNGAQPLVCDSDSATHKLVLSVNGEIYNHNGLKDIVLQNRHNFSTKSDCEVILYLYKEFSELFMNMLDGVFAFILYDEESNDFLVARDPIGVNPLYYAVNDKVLEEDYKVLKKVSKQVKEKMKDLEGASYQIHSTKYETNFAFVETWTSNIQTYPEGGDNE